MKEQKLQTNRLNTDEKEVLEERIKVICDELERKMSAVYKPLTLFVELYPQTISAMNMGRSLSEVWSSPMLSSIMNRLGNVHKTIVENIKSADYSAEDCFNIVEQMGEAKLRRAMTVALLFASRDNYGNSEELLSSMERKLIG